MYITEVVFVSATTVVQFVLSSETSILYPLIGYAFAPGSTQSNFIRVSSKATPVKPVTLSGSSPAKSFTVVDVALLPRAFVANTR